MSKTIHLGISTCPNDTFAFHGILCDRIDTGDFEFDIELLDVEELNKRLLEGEFDAAKASYHAALHLSDHMGVLAAGSALGFGVGPLLLSNREGIKPEDPVTDAQGNSASARILCPGEHTTATLLYQMFHPGAGEIEQAIFSEVMPGLVAGEADFGVCIHEGRFTYQKSGLFCVEDLGQRWEQATGCPLPLGGILGRKRLGAETLRKLSKVIRRSVEYGMKHRLAALPTMRGYAQDLSDEVMLAHVDLYVNQWTIDLGDEGRKALVALKQKASEAGFIEDEPELEVFG